MAAPAYVGSDHRFSSETGTITHSVPSGSVVADNLWIVSIQADQAGDPVDFAAPSGWTFLEGLDVGGAAQQPVAIYYRVAQSGDPATWEFTTLLEFPGIQSVMSEYSGVDTTTPINASGIQANSSSSFCTAPGITTTVNDCLLLFVGLDVNGRAYTPPSGMTERWEHRYNTGVIDISQEGATETFATAGSTGTRAATLNAATDNAGVLIAISPPSGGGVGSVGAAAYYYRHLLGS